jgi:hypothetical protein
MYVIPTTVALQKRTRQAKFEKGRGFFVRTGPPPVAHLAKIVLLVCFENVRRVLSYICICFFSLLLS